MSLLRYTEDRFLEISEYACFFYLHFGQDFSCLYGGWAEIIIIVCPLYDNQRNTLCQRTTQHHTSHTWTLPFTLHLALNTRDIASWSGFGPTSACCGVYLIW